MFSSFYVYIFIVFYLCALYLFLAITFVCNQPMISLGSWQGGGLAVTLSRGGEVQTELAVVSCGPYQVELHKLRLQCQSFCVCSIQQDTSVCELFIYFAQWC